MIVVKPSIDQMVETLGKLPAPTSSEDAIANYLMANISMNRSKTRSRDQDRETIKAVLQAYAKMLQDEGVKVVGEKQWTNDALDILANRESN